MMRRFLVVLVLVFLFSLAACSPLLGEPLATPIPTWHLPTAIAQTFQAAQAATASEAAAQAETPPAPLTPRASAGVSPTTPARVSATAGQDTPPAITSPAIASPLPSALPANTVTPRPSPTPGFTPTPTPLPDIPIAGIQIFRPGNLSRIASPLRVSAYLRPGAGGKVRVELFGEDGRLMVRQIRAFSVNPDSRVTLSLDLEFQIVAVAEAARLVISVDDEHGRLMALNSVDLILLSVGETDVNPSDALLESILIEQPQVQSLVQGGTVLVRGLALPVEGGRLEAALVDEAGAVVGFRLLSLGKPLASGYAPFAVEIPYQVTALTPVRLSVYRTGGDISPYSYFSSLEIFVSP